MVAAALAAHERAAAVFCSGPLLDAVQRARLFNDAKYFVDMPLRREPEEALAAFEALSPAERADRLRLAAFVDEFFALPGTELEPYVPKDWLEEPPFVSAHGVREPALREFAVALHKLWPTLCRVTSPAVAAEPQRFTALPRRHPVVLPGGRFRETYYWDSFWIVYGLLASGMLELAKGLVQNLLDDVDKFGFVPNGGRIYYLSRSQPPMLCAMVATVARALSPEAAAMWLPGAIAALRREYDWWMNGDRAISIGGTKLNRYFADCDKPRPESYWQDYETAGGDAHVCREIAAAAETGWDFTSRWAKPGTGARDGMEAFHLRDMATTSVLPICLNSIMYHAEVTLATLCEVAATGRPLSVVEAALAIDATLSHPEAEAFLMAAKSRRVAIDKLFWRPHLGRWVDVWLPASLLAHGGSWDDIDGLWQEGDSAPTLADFAPALWAGLATPEQAAACMVALRASGLMGPGGVATALVETGEQWDAPNAWAPLQSMLIEGLGRSGAAGSASLAAEIAQTWVGTCYAAWRTTGCMHEKYSAAEFGKGGAGGEYEPQVGFGWSNGVVLDLLAKYGMDLEAPAVGGKKRLAECMG